MEVDSNFVTDAVIYYNLPVVSPRTAKKLIPSRPVVLTPPTKCKRTISSCPASPMLNLNNSRSPDAENADNTGITFKERKSSRRSSFYMWWKKKRRSSCSPNGTRCRSENVQGNSDFYSMTNNTADSLTSYSTTVDGDNDDCDQNYINICGGTSYVKREPKQDPEYQNVSLTQVDPFASRVNYWQKQARWLSRRKLERTHRKTGEESIDIGIIYCSVDGMQWAEFIEKDLIALLSSNAGHPVPRIQVLQLEDYTAAKSEMVVQENLFKCSKVQIVIISPAMLSLLSSKREVKLDRLFNPKRIIALMLKVDPQEIQGNATVAFAFYSFEDWIQMEVKDRNTEFVRSVRDQVLQLLINCDAYSDFSVTKNFSLCPRKVSKQSNQVYIHLKTPIKVESSIFVTLQGRQGDMEKNGSANVTFHNPYTLSFPVPEKHLKNTSCFLYVYLSINEQILGWRELKCEGSLEVLVTALETVSDPTEVMTQALGISMIQGSLDSVLASRLKKNLPLHLLTDQDENITESMKESHLPTWLHFGAHYGLSEYCCTLLKVPGSKQLCNCRNSHGDTPAVLAYKSGFIDLAKMLETYAFHNISEDMNFSLHLQEDQSTRRQRSPSPNSEQVPSPHPRYTPIIGSVPLPEYEDSCSVQKYEGNYSLKKPERSYNLQNIEDTYLIMKPTWPSNDQQ